jgi:spore germination protein GerM
MIHRRALPATITIALLLAVTAGCTPGSGSLGTPATPLPTSAPATGPRPSDAVPPSPTPSPTPVPTPAISVTPTATASAPVGSASPSPATTPTPTATPEPTSVPTTIVRNYLFLGSFNGNEGLAPVLREVLATKAVATAAMRTLLAGPTSTEQAASPALYTTIPDGTRLLGLSIADGVATVNLSRAFESGGGSASMLGRLSQVVYTLTQFPTVDAVRFQVEGIPVTTFGSEGIVLDHPVGRADFQGQLPAIFVDRPAWGASLGNPGSVSGLANVFEATFQVELRNAGGKVLAQRTVMATCGTGCWGTFSASLSYDLAKAQYGTLRVFDHSAKDGTPENATEYRVWLTPGG